MNLPKDLPLRQRHVLIAAFLFLLGLGLYANSFQNEMFWDDDDFILKNRYIQDWKYLPQYFSENAIAGHYLLSNYWRPVLLLLFSLEWHLWQDWAPGYHIVSTCLHAVDSLLLYWLLFLLFKNQGLAFSTSLIFLIHPVQTEAVVYANAVSDSLTSLFVFLSLISYTRLRLRQPQPLRPYLSFPYLSSLILYILGLMSKETAFVLPGYLLLIESILKQGSSSFKEKILTAIRSIGPFLLVAGVYLCLRATVLNFNNTFNFYKEENVFTANFDVRLFTFFRVLTVYFGLLFLPLDLHVERSVALATSLFSGWAVVLGAGLFLGLIFLATREFKHRRVVSFGILWFFIGLLPSSNLLIPINALLYEHFLYLPLIGIFLAVISRPWEAAKRKHLKPILGALLGGYLVFFCGRTIVRNQDWKDPITFYENLLTHAPDSYRVINNLGMAYAEGGFLQKAEGTYRKAIALDPANPVAYHNIAGVYRNSGRIDLAIKNFEKAIQLNPRFIFSYKSLAQLYYDQIDYLNARKTLERVLPYTEEKAEILHLLAQMAYKQGDFAGARAYLQKALEIDPQNQALESLFKKVEYLLR